MLVLVKVDHRLILAVFLTFVIPVVLAHLYQLIAVDGWLVPAIVNSILVIGGYRYLSIKSASFVYYLPAIGLLAVYFLAVISSSFIGLPSTDKLTSYHLWSVVWIPIIEELLFRVIIGNHLRKLAGRFWGSYCSVICFAFVHSIPTVDRIIALDIGLALGPMLLAIVCEYLYLKSGSILPAILFHAVANGSVVIFVYYDSRWLNWLGWFYQ